VSLRRLTWDAEYADAPFFLQNRGVSQKRPFLRHLDTCLPGQPRTRGDLSQKPSQKECSLSHLQGVANFRRIAGVWRQRAIRLSEDEPQSKHVPEPTVDMTVATPNLTVDTAAATQRRDYSKLRDYEVLHGINSGEFTETEAVHVYVRKSLDGLRELYEGDELHEKEADYAEVVFGEPQTMIGFCLSRATEHLGEGAPPDAVSPGNYEVAARWYAMAGRFAHEAARHRRDEDPQVTDES
jgi:hypothetical protein